METNQFGLLAALTYAICMFIGAGINMLWWAKINPFLRGKSTMTFKELVKRVRDEH